MFGDTGEWGKSFFRRVKLCNDDKTAYVVCRHGFGGPDVCAEGTSAIAVRSFLFTPSTGCATPPPTSPPAATWPAARDRLRAAPIATPAAGPATLTEALPAAP